jgi:hypothetical protein
MLTPAQARQPLAGFRLLADNWPASQGRRQQG